MGQFGRLLGYLKPYRKRVTLSVFLLMCITLTPVAMPMIVRYTIDVVLPQKRWGALNGVFWMILGIFAIRGVVSYSLNYLIGWLGQRVVFDLRFQSYRHLHRLALSYYDTRQTGKIMARLTGDIDTIQYMISGGFVTFMADVFSLFAIMTALFWMQWRLALIAVGILPLYVINYKLFIRHIRPISEQLRERWDAMLGALQEKIVGITVVKAFVREDHETEQVMKTVKDNFDLSMTQTRLNRKLTPLPRSSAPPEPGPSSGTAARSSCTTGCTLANCWPSIAWSVLFTTRRCASRSSISPSSGRAQPSTACSRRWTRAPTSPIARCRRPAPDARRRHLPGGLLRLRPGQSVLHDINLEVLPGEVIAIVGPSGRAKPRWST